LTHPSTRSSSTIGLSLLVCVNLCRAGTIRQSSNLRVSLHLHRIAMPLKELNNGVTLANDMEGKAFLLNIFFMSALPPAHRSHPIFQKLEQRWQSPATRPDAMQQERYCPPLPASCCFTNDVRIDLLRRTVALDRKEAPVASPLCSGAKSTHPWRLQVWLFRIVRQVRGILLCSCKELALTRLLLVVARESGEPPPSLPLS